MMRTATDFADWLKVNHAGKDNAINARDMKQWGSRRVLRFMVHELRRTGHPICSGFTGYYYAATSAEIKQTLAFLDSIQEDLSKVISGLEDTYLFMHRVELNTADTRVNEGE